MAAGLPAMILAVHWLTIAFLLALFTSTSLELWLSQRQLRAIARHRDRVPGPFADSISAQDHGKAADYSIAKLRLGRVHTMSDALLTLLLTLGGAIAAADALWRHTTLAQPWLGVLVIATVALVMQIVYLPFALWRTFVLETRFGFNRTTPMLFQIGRASCRERV